jgi:hypothetical protein
VLHTTSINRAELLYGVAAMQAGRRPDGLAALVEAMFAEDLPARSFPYERGGRAFRPNCRYAGSIATACRASAAPSLNREGGCHRAHRKFPVPVAGPMQLALLCGLDVSDTRFATIACGN